MITVATVAQRCHRVERLCRELVAELKAHAYYDRDFKAAKIEAEKTLDQIDRACKKKTEWY